MAAKAKKKGGRAEGTAGSSEPKKRKAKVRVIFTRGKRKEAVARASVRKGSGIVRINRMGLSTITNPYLRRIISEPLEMAGEAARNVDIEVNVHGGGPMGQAEAARMAIARGLVEFTGDDGLRKAMLERDRHMLSEDSRRVEPKKYKGPKARARFQKSYR